MRNSKILLRSVVAFSTIMTASSCASSVANAGPPASIAASPVSATHQVEPEPSAAAPAEIAPVPAAAPEAPSAPSAPPAAKIEQVAATPVITLDAKKYPKGMRTGAQGDEVVQLENRLDQLRFNVGKKDGKYDYMLVDAVLAFQKQQGLPRSGRADQPTLDRLANVTSIGNPWVPHGEPTRVEVDLQRQAIQIYKDGMLLRVVGVSSGNNQHYCVKANPEKKISAYCDKAITPGGTFRAERKISGTHVSPLGELYNPIFFNAGIALHGSNSVPAQPASHGCVRVPRQDDPWLFKNVDLGTAVYVLNGQKAAPPFGAAGVPSDQAANPASPSADNTTPSASR